LNHGWEEIMKHVGRLFVILFIGLAAAAASAENSFLDYYSPLALGGGAETATVDSPMGTIFNPSLSADRQRLTFDFSYLALPQVTPAFLWGGNAVNLGVTWPTRVGVLSGIARFSNADYAGTGLEWGALGSLDVSFSKDLFSDLYVGAGLQFTYGAQGAASDWGLGLDLGFLSLVGDLSFMKDFRWGVALRNLGKPYDPSPAASSLGYAPAFTPAVGASFALLKTDMFNLSAAPDLSFPSFQDVRLKLAASFSVARAFFLDAAYVLDLREVLGAEPARTIPFQFGMSINLNNLTLKPAGAEVNEARSAVAVTPLSGGA
jgi:hypothetical protein